MRKAGEASAALPVLTRAAEAVASFYGTEHPALSSSILLQAKAEAALGRPDEARGHALQAEAIARRHFQRTASWLSEREALRFEQVRVSGLDLALSSLIGTPSRHPAAIARAWDAVIRSRALVLDELAARRQIASSVEDEGMARLVDRLEAQRNRVAAVSACDSSPSLTFHTTPEASVTLNFGLVAVSSSPANVNFPEELGACVLSPAPLIKSRVAIGPGSCQRVSTIEEEFSRAAVASF